MSKHPLIAEMKSLENELRKEYRSNKDSMKFLSMERDLGKIYDMVMTVYGCNFKSVFCVSA